MNYSNWWLWQNDPKFTVSIWLGASNYLWNVQKESKAFVGPIHLTPQLRRELNTRDSEMRKAKVIHAIRRRPIFEINCREKTQVYPDVYALDEISNGGRAAKRRGEDGAPWRHPNSIKGQEWGEVKELIKISKLEINTIIGSWTCECEIISGRAIKKPFRASIKVITIKGSASSKCHEKLIMIANQKKWSLFGRVLVSNRKSSQETEVTLSFIRSVLVELI